MAVHSCEDGTFLRRAAAGELRIGDCLFDGAGATEVYYTDGGRAPGLVYIEAGEKRTAVTHDHLVHTADGVVPARFLTAGAALAANETVTRIWSDEADASVSLIYTKSGRIVADGIIVSSYEHWTDPWLSLDAYFLYLLKATDILESQPYKLYFRTESAFLDPIVHWLWPHA